VKNTQECVELIQESEEKFRKIAENSLVGMFIYKEYFIYVNDAFCKMTGYSAEELLHMHPWEITEECEQEAFKKLIKRRLAGEMFSFIHNDSLLVKKNQERLSVKVSAETIKYDGGYAGIGITIDISDIVKKNQMIKVLVQALSQSDDIVFITDIKSVITYANDALSVKYGFPLDEVIGKKPSIFSSHKHSKEFYANLWETVLRGENYNVVITNQKRDGSLIYVDTKITPVKDERGESIAYFVVTARDITKRIEAEEKLKEQAMIDPLTQVANRHQLEIYFDDFIARSMRDNHPFSVLMFDIDHFKHINDEHGHLVGDEILKSLSQFIVDNIRSVDKFARWGGEEFILLLDGAKEHEAMQIGEKLNQLIANTRLDELYCITVSIGVTEYRRGDTKERAIERADMALYAAKDLGRNRVVFN